MARKPRWEGGRRDKKKRKTWESTIRAADTDGDTRARTRTAIRVRIVLADIIEYSVYVLKLVIAETFGLGRKRSDETLPKHVGTL